ncbi:MAG: cytochrome c oxidase subunit II, partial [Tabrizicola sp.]
MRLSTVMNGVGVAAMAMLVAGQALAQQALEIVGQPVDGAIGFQPAVTELAEDLHWLDHMILYVIAATPTPFITVERRICLIPFRSR